MTQEEACSVEVDTTRIMMSEMHGRSMPTIGRSRHLAEERFLRR